MVSEAESRVACQTMLTSVKYAMKLTRPLTTPFSTPLFETQMLGRGGHKKVRVRKTRPTLTNKDKLFNDKPFNTSRQEVEDLPN